jgi:endo-1,3(4)-beta-glucanase
MFALPHHLQSFSSATKRSVTSIQLQTTTKGLATAVVADSWILVEPNMPIGMGFAPWSPVSGSQSSLSANAIAAILTAATNEVSQNMSQQTNLNSVYYAGKVFKLISKPLK